MRSEANINTPRTKPRDGAVDSHDPHGAGAAPLGVRKIEAGPRGGRLTFNDRPDVNPDTVIRLIQQQPQHYKLDGSNRLRFLMELDDPERRINSVQVLLEALSRKVAA